MPLDYRRFTGPEDCSNPYDFEESSVRSNQDLLAHFQKCRPDGRSHSQLRQIFLKAGAITQARGSAYLEMNQTKVICAVHGPREVLRREDFSLKGQLTCDFKFLTFSCNHLKQHQQDEQEKDLSVSILEALESSVCLHKYPKSQINIYISVLQNDGSILAASIMAASVALASAGVEMYDVVLASSLALHGSLKLMDPTAEEEDVILNADDSKEMNAGTLTVAFLPSINQVSTVSTDGQVSPEVLTEGLQICVENCQKLEAVVRHCLFTHFTETRKQQK